MEVLYHIRPYFLGIFPEILALKKRPKIYGRSGPSNQSFHFCMASDPTIFRTISGDGSEPGSGSTLTCDSCGAPPVHDAPPWFLTKKSSVQRCWKTQ